MRPKFHRLWLSLPALALLAACQTTVPASQGESTRALVVQAQVPDTYEQDREAILAMAGDYHVTFDFTETVPLLAGYELKDKKLSGGFEVVRVIEDTGDFISLQHILVVGPADAPMVVKHWRQDWQYEPAEVMVFIGGNAWEMREVSAESAEGSWSQIVYQVDDSPRYGALGHWKHEAGVSQWEPPAEWRPLPRRDMTTRDDYNAVDAINRHAITPFGWVHEQDNTKLILSGAEPTALVREIGVNTYRHSDEFDPTPAIEYWEATADYWAFIRGEWENIATGNKSFAIDLFGETDEMYGPLLTIADDIQSGKSSVEDVQAEVRSIFADYVVTDLKPLHARLRPTDTKLAAAE